MPKEDLDISKVTAEQLVSQLRIGQLWSVGIVIAGLLGGSFTLGYKVSSSIVGAIFLPFKEMAPLVDLVRNKKPVYAYMNSDRPQWNSLKTSKEPVGEEES